MKICNITVDVDSLNSILKGFGLRRKEYSYREFEVGIENLMNFFAQYNIKATLFFVAKDLEIEKTAEYFNLFSILPPFLAIVVALLFQKTILALFAGVWLGATLLEGMNPFTGLWRFAEKYLYQEALKDQFRVDIIGFVIALCATVGIMTRGGGIQGFVNKLVKLAKSVRSTQFVTYLMGIAIFFDDYANCIIVGNTLRPLTDRMKISREKLSYIVDSTAAPVAGLSMLSTWIAYEVSTFSAQLPEAGVEEGAYRIFFETIPYRFYCIFTLAFMAINGGAGSPVGSAWERLPPIVPQFRV